MAVKMTENGYKKTERQLIFLYNQDDSKISINGHHSDVSQQRITVSGMLEKGTPEVLLQMGKGLERKIKILFLTFYLFICLF